MAQAEERLTELGGGVFMLSTNIRPLAGNITFAVGKSGVVVVDARFAELYDRIRAGIRRVTDLPVQFLINTHHHGDHVGCNCQLGVDGAIVIAQTLAAEHLAYTSIKADELSGPAVTELCLPSVTFDERLAMQVGQHSLSLYHPPFPRIATAIPSFIFARSTLSPRETCLIP